MEALHNLRHNYGHNNCLTVYGKDPACLGPRSFYD